MSNVIYLPGCERIVELFEGMEARPEDDIIVSIDRGVIYVNICCDSKDEVIHSLQKALFYMENLY